MDELVDAHTIFIWCGAMIESAARAFRYFLVGDRVVLIQGGRTEGHPTFSHGFFSDYKAS